MSRNTRATGCPTGIDHPALNKTGQLKGIDMMKERYYFAYGSNLNQAQMLQRCPKASPVSRAVLGGWRLYWQGVLTILKDPGAQVHGALWKTTPKCERSLDRYEGHPHLYRKETTQVVLPTGKRIEAYVYIMNKVGPAVWPSQHYLQSCLWGAYDWDISLDLLTDSLPGMEEFHRERIQIKD